VDWNRSTKILKDCSTSSLGNILQMETA